MRRIITFALIIGASLQAFAVAVSAQNQKPPTIVAIRAGRLIDVENGRVLTNQLIIVENDRIKSVGPDSKIPDGATVIDLSNATVIPGFIDTHTHLTGNMSDGAGAGSNSSFIDAAVLIHLNARATLDAGFTTVRDLGSMAFIDVALRRAIQSGRIPGPRMQVCGYYIGSTGSHGDTGSRNPWIASQLPPEMNGIVNGPDEARKKVRYLAKFGAGVIKMGASAGVLSEEESVGAPQLTQEEMNAIVDEARVLGLKVAAHAHGTEAIKMAIKAGVASIEHGSFIDDDGIRMMKERGTYLSADIYNDDYIMSEFTRLGYPQRILDKEKLVGRTQRENFRKAVNAGVKIAYGTDAGIYPHGWNAKQFSKMVEWGQTPMQAIQSATINSADLLGWKDRVGSVSPGKLADIVAVSGNPLEKISVLENVEFVMKGGVVYKNLLVR